MRSDDRCRSCGAPIRWAIHVGTHKRMPLDTEANAGGNIGVVEWVDQGEAWALPVVAVNPSPGTQATPYRYTSHFATCPQANQWRKR